MRRFVPGQENHSKSTWVNLLAAQSLSEMEILMVLATVISYLPSGKFDTYGLLFEIIC